MRSALREMPARLAQYAGFKREFPWFAIERALDVDQGAALLCLAEFQAETAMIGIC